jgi:hypothetical protein
MFKPLTYTFQGIARRINTFERKATGETVQQLVVAGLGETVEANITNQDDLQKATAVIGKTVEMSGEEIRSDRFQNTYLFGDVKELRPAGK